MGSTNPDRISSSQWRASAPTIGKMYEKRWRIVAICRTCRLEMVADLEFMIFKRGPELDLWNRTSRCRRVGCRGVVDFYFRAPGMMTHRVLVSSAAESLPVGHVMRAFEEEREKWK